MKDADERPNDQQNPWQGVPAPLSHRASLKWLTLEALRVLQGRLQQRGMSCRVMLWNGSGVIQGQLADIVDYDEALRASSCEQVDSASACGSVRTELWKVYVSRDPALVPIDNGALIHVQDAVMRIGARRLKIPHLTLFASEIHGFALLSKDIL